MANYQTIVVCPLCQHQRWLTKEDSWTLVGDCIYYRDVEWKCNNCDWSFSAKNNLVFQRVHDGQTGVTSWENRKESIGARLRI